MSRLQTYGTMGAGLAALLLAILDQTIVASAAAPIAHDLQPAGGVGQIPWLIAAYTVASTCSQPLYGKLADRFGPRRLFLTTLGLFLAGSALCAAANSMGELIGFRAVQGLGGGGLLSVTIVALAHLRHERPDLEGDGGGNMMAAALVGIGLVLGPTVGGQIVEHLSWRMVFLINLPLGGLAWVVAWACMRLAHPDERTPLDLLGSALLALVAACLLLACQWGGQRYAWGSWQILTLSTLGLAAVAAFVVRQLRTAAPLFPVRVIALHNVRAIALLQLLTGIGMTGSAIYVTIELQLVHGISPAATGVRLLPMAAGLAVGSVVGRRLLQSLETLTRAIALGAVLSAATFAALALLGAGVPYGLLAALLCLLGCGIGVGMGTEVIALQQIVERRHLGIATAGVRFVETLGGALAASGLGVLFATGLHSSAPAAAAAAVHPVFAICAGVMAIAGGVALAMPLHTDEASWVRASDAAATGRSRRTPERREPGKVTDLPGRKGSPAAAVGVER
jgi:EmrB/QacA subfamily drug resistance transporter